MNKENHMSPTIFIISKGRKQNLNFAGQDSKELYDFVHAGDSIIKPSGSLSVRVIRNKRGHILDTTLVLCCVPK
jgi:hypothetical protein